MPKKVKLPRGVQARIAKELGVTAAHVSLVAAGKAVSARVSAAIARAKEK